MAARKGAVKAVKITPIEIEEIVIKILGDNPLITHNWDHKVRREILDKHTGEASTTKDKKDPFRDYVGSLYFMDGTDPGTITTQKQVEEHGYGMPAGGLRKCAVAACSSIELQKVVARECFRIVGEAVPKASAFPGCDGTQQLVRIDGKPRMREDMVRVGMNRPDIRYRAEFWPWSCTFTVRFDRGVMSATQVVNLFNRAGFGVGLCEWRPQKDGDFGTFSVGTA